MGLEAASATEVAKPIVAESRLFDCDDLHIESSKEVGGFALVHLLKQRSNGKKRLETIGNPVFLRPIPEGHTIGEVAVDYKFSPEHNRALPFARIQFVPIEQPGS